MNPMRPTPPPRKPILFWRAYLGNKCVDENNSISLLRSKWAWEKKVIYKAIR